jgi:nucleotide-binding universal stress UspA family protein
MYHRIVVALDGSELAERILPHAEALAEKFGATLYLLRAAEPIPPSLLVAEAAAGAVTLPEDTLHQDQQDAASYLRAVCQRLRGRGINAQVEAPDGVASGAITTCAAELEADLIAMTTLGRGGLGRAVLGSVADSVVRHAPCPVLLVRVAEE